MARERPAGVETGPVVFSFAACGVPRVVGGLLGGSARIWWFRIVGVGGFRPRAVFVHGTKGGAFLDANGVGVAISLVSEVDFIQGECSEAGCVVDLQDTLLEWQLSDDGFAGDHRQGVEHLGSWIA